MCVRLMAASNMLQSRAQPQPNALPCQSEPTLVFTPCLCTQYSESNIALSHAACTPKPSVTCSRRVRAYGTLVTGYCTVLRETTGTLSTIYTHTPAHPIVGMLNAVAAYSSMSPSGPATGVCIQYSICTHTLYRTVICRLGLSSAFAFRRLPHEEGDRGQFVGLEIWVGASAVGKCIVNCPARVCS